MNSLAQTPVVRVVVDCCRFVVQSIHNNSQQIEASGVWAFVSSVGSTECKVHQNCPNTFTDY